MSSTPPRSHIGQYEDAETYDHSERARRQTLGRIGLITLLLATVQPGHLVSSPA